MTIKIQNVIRFGDDKTRYMISAINKNNFDAIRLAQGARAMWQPIAIRVTPITGTGLYQVMNLNNKKVVLKEKLHVTAPTAKDIKNLNETLVKYKDKKNLPSWTTNYKFLGEFRNIPKTFHKATDVRHINPDRIFRMYMKGRR